MEAALRVVSVERGFDPRDFILVAFGGAGPLHACDVAAALKIPRVLVPEFPGVLSALGMATAPVIKEMSASVMTRFEGDGTSGRAAQQAAAIRTTRDVLAGKVKAELRAEGFDLRRARTQTVLEMRYAGQSYELAVAANSLDAAAFTARFHRAHRERYGHSDATRAVEVVNVRVRVVLPGVARPAAGGRLKPSATSSRRATPSAIERRRVCFGDGQIREVETPFFDRKTLEPGHAVRGPAIVTQMDCTTVVPPGWRAEVDAFRNLLMTRAGRR
jgi:N-methylhydantoinase A